MSEGTDVTKTGILHAFRICFENSSINISRHATNSFLIGN